MEREKHQWMTRGLYRAADAVGHTPRERLAWLLDLVQLDAKALAQRDVTGLLDEVVFFTVACGHIVGGPPAYSDIAAIDREFLTPIRSALADLSEYASWTFPQPKINFITSLKEGQIVEGSAPVLFVYQAARLFDQQRDALRQCDRCTRWFVAVRPFQKYCSLDCGRAVANHNYQKKLTAARRRKRAAERDERLPAD